MLYVVTFTSKMNFAGYVFDILHQAVADPYNVTEQTNANLSSSSIIQNTEMLTLHLIEGFYDLILYNPYQHDKVFKLFHLPASKKEEALRLYDHLSYKLLVLCKTTDQCFNVKKLQSICTIIRNHNIWSPAHIAVEAGLENVFNESLLKKWINSQSCEQHYTPLHIACQLKADRLVKQIVESGADLEKCDDNGNTPIHLSINVGCHKIVTILCAAASYKQLHIENNAGETALHIACQLNRHDLCQVMLEYGFNPLHCGSIALPIHYALKHKARKCLQVLLDYNPDQVKYVCKKHGGIPLHWCKTDGDVNLLFKYDSPTNVASKQSHLPLHIMVLRGRLEAAVSIILGNADVNSKGRNGNTALHLAVFHDYVELVKMLLLFGADGAVKNDFGETPSLLAIRSNKPHKEEIVSMFSCIGGLLIGNYDKPGSFKISHSFENPNENNNACNGSGCGLKVLCLDGGGVRGLITTQILMAIEKACGRKCKDIFDWIAGTSTGGILTVGLAQGKSAVECQRLYFRLKDKIFIGSRPYKCEPMEEFLKQEFGENNTMENIRNGPKIVITASRVGCKPAQLHLFKNYNLTDSCIKMDKKAFSKKLSNTDMTKLQTSQVSCNQLLWKAARCSGAAPTYFRPMDCFLDGGLISNNPTLDTLTEIHRYNKACKRGGCHDDINRLGMVVSVGTGRVKSTLAKSVDVIRPTNPVALVNSALAGIELTQIMIDVACETSGHVVERAKAWCEMVDAIYTRLNPFIEEDIPLDETDNNKLLHIMWETQIYLHEQQDLIEEIAYYLNK